MRDAHFTFDQRFQLSISGGQSQPKLCLTFVPVGNKLTAGIMRPSITATVLPESIDADYR